MMHSMSKNAVALLAGIAGATACSVANAAVIVNDGFEYTDQAAFNAAWPAVTSAPTLDAVRPAASGAKSVTIPAASTARARGSFGETTPIRFYEPGIATSLVWSFDFYDSNSTANPYRGYSNLQDTTAPGGTNQLVSMGMNNNQLSANSGGNYYMARILGYTNTTVDPDGGPDESVTGAGIYFKLNDFGVGTRSTGWHNLKVVISTDDNLSADYAFYVDNVLAERVNNVGTAASFARQFDNITLSGGVTSAAEYGLDNMYLEVVPEPTTLAALGLAGVGMIRRRK